MEQIFCSSSAALHLIPKSPRRLAQTTSKSLTASDAENTQQVLKKGDEYGEIPAVRVTSKGPGWTLL